MKDLNNDKSIVIVPADKGRCTVVLNEKDYDHKCNDLLKDTKTYKKIGYNPTSGYRQKVVSVINALHKDKIITDTLKWSLTPPSQPTVPAFYGLPKNHKAKPIQLCSKLFNPPCFSL